MTYRRWFVTHCKYTMVLILVGVIVAFFSSCGMPFSYGFDGVWEEEETQPPVTPPTFVLVQGTEFTMTWNEGDSDSYRVYQRTHGDTEWTFLATVTGSSELVVDSSMLAYGEYEFAVSEMIDGEESEFHTSLDETADPTCGWYLRWEAPA